MSTKLLTKNSQSYLENLDFDDSNGRTNIGIEKTKNPQSCYNFQQKDPTAQILSSIPDS